MIPKVIHYCWFGGEKDDLSKRCIDSWYKIFEGFDIVEWNESNIDISKQPSLVQELYNSKKYGFVTDFLRFNILYENGGIYLDTDVLAIKNFDESFLSNKFFIGVEKSTRVALGIIGTEKGSRTAYDLNEFTINSALKDGVKINTHAIMSEMRLRGFRKVNDEIVNLGDITIYPQEYFYPIPCEESIPYKMSDKSVCAHLWNASWVSKNTKWYKEKERIVNKYLKELEDTL